MSHTALKLYTSNTYKTTVTMSHKNILRYNQKFNRTAKSLVITESEDGKVYVSGNKNILQKISESAEMEYIIEVVRQEQHDKKNFVHVLLYNCIL